jgi:hypothetical protein
MMTATCTTCVLGLDPCWARDAGAARVCDLVRSELAALARGEPPASTYRDLVKQRSDAGWEPPMTVIPPDGQAPPPAPVVTLPPCPDRGPQVDAAGCATFLCRRYTRVVSGCECGRCASAGFAYVG